MSAMSGYSHILLLEKKRSPTKNTVITRWLVGALICYSMLGFHLKIS